MAPFALIWLYTYLISPTLVTSGVLEGEMSLESGTGAAKDLPPIDFTSTGRESAAADKSPPKIEVLGGWNVFEVISDVDNTESVKNLLHIPFDYSWDSKRGVYRPMANLEAAEKEVSEALSSIGHTLKQSSMAVNNPEMFMLFISALQHVLELYPYALEEVEYLEAEQAAFSLGVVRFAEEMKRDYNHKSAAEMRAERGIAITQQRMSSVAADLARERLRHERAVAAARLTRRKELYDDHEARLLALAEELLTRLEKLTADKVSRLESIFSQDENATYSFESASLETEANTQLRVLASDVSIAVEAIKLRAVAEAEVEEENIDIHLNMIEARGRVSIENFEVIVRKVFDEVLGRSGALYQEPWLVVQGASIVLGFLVVLLLAYEAGTLARQALITLLSRRSVLNRHSAGDGSAFSEFTSVNDILLEPRAEKKLRAHMHQLRSAAEQKLELPNVLVSGPPGVGKTTAAAIICLDDSVDHPADALPPVAVICGGDLLALGDSAASYLRRILENSDAHSRGCLVVLDGFDDIIAKRSGSEESAHHDTLCGLLFALRVGSPRLAVVLTSSLPHSAIDDAILDRMDSVLALDFPSVVTRCTLVRRLAITTLPNLLSREALTWLKSGDPLFRDARLLEAEVETACGPERTGGSRIGGKSKVGAGKLIGTQGSKAALDIRICLLRTIGATRGLSHREVSKVIKNVHNAALAADTAVLTTDSWLKLLPGY